ncbi:hypothetical protein OUZ56_030059 [Daphnia magna]|uniref:THAP-type domain-containing protein n=1 Tax=Daphnia magna TaxID=35525 RepID=A0ABQ9ZRG8_9CRUS|nr:hypothetical protein OUZ56_030059 [Daphnia magna]
MSCCVLGFRTGYKPTKKYPNPLKHCVFTFPKDVELRAKWIAAVGRSHWNPTCRSVVCARHFLSSDCREDNRIIADESVNLFDSFRKRLLPTAIPSVNLTPQEESQPRLPTIRKRKMLEDSVICSASSMPVKRKTYERNKCHLIMPDSQTSQPVATLTRSLSLAGD